MERMREIVRENLQPRKDNNYYSNKRLKYKTTQNGYEKDENRAMERWGCSRLEPYGYVGSNSSNWRDSVASGLSEVVCVEKAKTQCDASVSK